MKIPKKKPAFIGGRIGRRSATRRVMVWSVFTFSGLLGMSACFDFDGYSSPSTGSATGVGLVACGTVVCDGVCCSPAEDQNGVISGECTPTLEACCPGLPCSALECDGPEDCGGGNLCCVYAAARAGGTGCMSPEDCDLFDMGYLCHSDEDCAGKGSCTQDDFYPMMKVCK